MITNESGWVVLPKSILEKGFYKKSAYLHVWVHLLLTACFKSFEIIINDQIVELHPGQLLTGRKSIAKATGIPESTVQRILNFFSKNHIIEQKTFNKFRIITIKNWNETQCFEHQENIKKTSITQQVNTKKNIKEVKRKKYISKSIKSNSNENAGYNRFDSGGHKNHRDDRL